MFTAVRFDPSCVAVLVADGHLTSGHSPPVRNLQHVVSVAMHRMTADDLEVTVDEDSTLLEKLSPSPFFRELAQFDEAARSLRSGSESVTVGA